jgi:ATP-dependent RNA helicase DeaD
MRARDQERLLHEVAQADEPTEEDLAAARALLAERTPEELASALVRLYRARLPAPEELSEPQTERSRDRPARPERPQSVPSGPSGEGVWFRMNVGRAAKADPKWMIPIICRRGGVTKSDIGDIRIMDRETLFEIAPRAAETFAAQLRQPDSVDPQIRIVPAGGEGPPAPERRYDNARPFKPKRAVLTIGPDRKAPDAGDRPLAKKRAGAKPREKR